MLGGRSLGSRVGAVLASNQLIQNAVEEEKLLAKAQKAAEKAARKNKRKSKAKKASAAGTVAGTKRSQQQAEAATEEESADLMGAFRERLAGVFAFAYPLHPSGKTAKIRDYPLKQLPCPVRVEVHVVVCCTRSKDLWIVF